MPGVVQVLGAQGGGDRVGKDKLNREVCVKSDESSYMENDGLLFSLGGHV